jgi:hypothetical protein
MKKHTSQSLWNINKNQFTSKNKKFRGKFSHEKYQNEEFLFKTNLKVHVESSSFKCLFYRKKCEQMTQKCHRIFFQNRKNYVIRALTVLM